MRRIRIKGVTMIIAGGCYTEYCTFPQRNWIYGSGFRAAFALSKIAQRIELHAYAYRGLIDDVEASLRSFEIFPHIKAIKEQITFGYFHPFARFAPDPEAPKIQESLQITGDSVVYFGLIEGSATIEASCVVYDPQSVQIATSFRSSGSRADSLAIVLNRNELTLLGASSDSFEAAQRLMQREAASVVILKHKLGGATVFQEGKKAVSVPAYPSDTFFGIGAGDVFCASFAHYWVERGLPPTLAADMAARSMAYYVDGARLPLPQPEELSASDPVELRASGHVFLAGPSATIEKRWVLEHAAEILETLDVKPIPLFMDSHDRAAIADASSTVDQLEAGHTLLAVGYHTERAFFDRLVVAANRGVQVVLLVDEMGRAEQEDLAVAGCTVMTDFASAIYHAAFKSMSP
jgi:hypothetical protein